MREIYQDEDATATTQLGKSLPLALEENGQIGIDKMIAVVALQHRFLQSAFG